MASTFHVRFLIVGTYRSGTSAIVEAVGRHPEVLCGMEWTHRLAPWRQISAAKAALAGDFSELLPRHRNQLAASRIDGKRVIGFKRLFRSSDKWLMHPALSPALMMDRFGAHIRWLRDDPAIRIVHIVRQDNIAWLKSKILSDATGRYSGAKYPDDLKLSIAPAEAKRRVAAKLWIDARLQSLSASNPYLRVNYEGFLEDNFQVTSRIVGFLGCDPADLPMGKLEHQSQSRASRATIGNIEELRRALGSLSQPTAKC
jgi:hypothetical protein